MYNQITIVGNLGRDPEARQTQNGATIVTLSVATTHRRKVGNEYQDQTTWHRVKAFGKTGEACMRFLTKGKRVMVVGRQENGHYEKDGQRVNTSEVVANEIKFLSPRDEGAQGQHSGSNPFGGGDNAGGPPDPYAPPSGQDDLPF